MKRFDLLWNIVFLVASCASVPMGSDAENQAALRFTPPPGMANVYIIRRPAFVGAAILATTALDTQMTGGLNAGSFILKTVAPGVHTVTVFSNENQASLPFTAEAGRNYFFDVKSQMGMVSARFSIHPMSTAASPDFFRISAGPPTVVCLDGHPSFTPLITNQGNAGYSLAPV